MPIETVVVGPFEVNCFIVWGDAKAALVIDPGSDPDRILAAIEDKGLSIAAYLLTHGHVDHVSGVGALHRVRPAPVAMHKDDRRWAFGAQNQMPPFYGVPEKPAAAERVLADGQEWTDGGLNYRIVGTPGHTPGGVCFYFPAQRTLFSGDTLFAGSVGRTDFPGGDSRVLARSLAELAKLPDDTRILAGHGPATTIGYEKQTNFFMQSL
jgi:glyoxylase-like metal-dependent hydrolase (beta-lactamase superfamily II)